MTSMIVQLVLAAAIAVWLFRALFLTRGRTAGKLSIGFFHPYCNDGGGGERVLWRMLDTLVLTDKERKLELIVYSGDSASPREILDKANDRFEINVPEDRVKFVYLRHRWLVEASTYPYFTMLGQSIGSMILALEALLRFCPHVFFDSMGYAFTFPVFRYLGGSWIACYVHYPTISTDMLARVSSGDASYNNSTTISSSATKTRLKLIYYNAFALLYSLVGNRADLIMANSSWTREHVIQIWKRSDVMLLFPACNTSDLQSFPLAPRERLLISVGQFRPEKNHSLQLAAYSAFKKNSSSSSPGEPIKFVMIGGTRVDNPKDQEIVTRLEREIKELGLQNEVVVRTNIPAHELRSWMSRARAGIHTMAHEHFGISIVELMAAGVVPVVHDSGGPRKDIVVPWQGIPTGFLATDVQSYAKALVQVFEGDEPADRKESDKDTGKKKSSLKEMQEAARASVAARFSDETFSADFMRLVRQLPCVRQALL